MTLPLVTRPITTDDDLARRALTVATYVLTLVVNGAANPLPSNGQRTNEISDRYEVYVVPAGYVFGIWGVIYLGLGTFTVYQAIRGDDPLVQRVPVIAAVGAIGVTAAVVIGGLSRRSPIRARRGRRHWPEDRSLRTARCGPRRRPS